MSSTTSSQPLILVTNDDGIAAPGLRSLVEIAKSFGEVVVVAPDSPQSGQGHAITLEDPLRIHPVRVFEGVDAYECSGTPVDCVKLAKHVILKERTIDLCLSGINHGSNAGINIIYSGTMSAAMEASLDGILSIGFSLLDFSHEADFSPVEPYVISLIQHALAGKFSPATLLNVNLPKGIETPIAGIKLCRQANARWIEEFQEGTDPQGRAYYWLTGKFVPEDVVDGTDIYALDEHFVSVVPSNHDLTDYSALKLMAPLGNLDILAS